MMNTTAPVHAAHRCPMTCSRSLRGAATTAPTGPGETVVDGTFGAGGYTRAILDAADTRVIAIDRTGKIRLSRKEALGQNPVMQQQCECSAYEPIAST